jgi:hypothetical protein
MINKFCLLYLFLSLIPIQNLLKFRVKEFDIRVFQIFEELCSLSRLQYIRVIFVDIQSLFDSTCIWRKNRPFIVPIIVVVLQLVFLRPLYCLLLNDFERIVFVVQVGSSDEKPFFSDEVTNIAIFLIFPSESRDFGVVCVHCSAHSIYELWLVRIHETIYLVCVLLYLFSEIKHFWKTFYFAKALLALHGSSPEIAFIIASKLNSRFILKLLHSWAVFYSFFQNFLIICSCVHIGKHFDS